ncbi:esterase/lipase family protein [Candidatus Uabimicrobium sp. HlEnr_7]|uniref:esterase/lipase family protein n=1 Tax=Candidatus Uabimicrobium helgolandensis TaxID=3095367 RepID=UPI003557242F
MKIVTFIILCMAVSCSGVDHLPLGDIYKQAAKNEDRNPVVLLHGITGARLVQQGTEKIVWGAFTEDGIDPNSKEGLRALAFPVWQVNTKSTPHSIAYFKDDVYASGPLDKISVNLFGINLSVDVYLSILQTLGVGGYLDQVYQDIEYDEDHYTCFSFFYDWRKDNITNAILLSEFLEKTAKYVTQKDKERGFNRGEVKFDIVAHSMGGLVARYYLQYGGVDITEQQDKKITWEGAKRVSRLIQVGTPNTGSISAVDALYNGQEYSFVLPKFQATLLTTYPSLYQLLPRQHHKVFIDRTGKSIEFDMYDASLWEKNKWGMFSENQKQYLKFLFPDDKTRVQLAKHYMQSAFDRAKQFHNALDAKPENDCPSQIVLFASKSMLTQEKVYVYEENGKLKLDFNSDLQAPGDGVVTISNALADNRQGTKWKPWVRSNIQFSATYLLKGDHLSMTTTQSFRNNILHLLLETPPLK